MTIQPRPVALITGSTSGIGSAIARRMVADGFYAIIHSVTSADAGRSMAAEMEHTKYLQADLAKESARIELIKNAAAQWGRLDVLINNAGISRIIPHSDLNAATPDIWRELYEVNVVAPWQLITEAVPIMRLSGNSPCIVNIASHAGIRPKGASIPYAVSKAALVHMTKLLAVTLAPTIRVNAIAPGLVDTPLTSNWDTAQKLWRDRAPMQRAAQPDDIAAVASMLVSSKYLTGEVILADGGMNLT